MFHTRKTLATLSGVPPGRIEFYAKERLFTDLERPGSGKPFEFSRENIFELFLIRELAMVGAVLGTIKKVMDQTRYHDLLGLATSQGDRRCCLVVRPSDPKNLCTVFHDSKFSKSRGRFEVDMKGHLASIVVDLTGIILEMQAKGL